jgi:hypothetical protein
MAYKSIKKGKGKRKGGKKSNRRTYKQNGGNKMLMMIIAVLVGLGIIFPVSAKFYNKVVNKEENQKKIEVLTSILNEYRQKLSNINLLDTKLLAAAIIPNPAQPFAVGNIVGNMINHEGINANIARTSNKISILEAEINEDYLFLTGHQLRWLLPYGITKDFGSSPDFEPGTTKVNTEPSSFSNMFSPSYVSAPITQANIGLPDVYALNINGWLNMIEKNMQLAKFAITTIVNKENEDGPTIEEIEGVSKL